VETAQEHVGVPSERENGMQALRHFSASTLPDAGESITAVREWLGHSSAKITLDHYRRLMPASESRTRAAIDAVLGPQ
jgi:integrase